MKRTVEQRNERATAGTRARELHRSIYGRHPCGCCWHIVLDDGNVDASSIAFCVAMAKEEGHPDCLELADLAPMLSRTQWNSLGRR